MMTYKFNMRRLRAAAVAGALLATGACSSSATDEADDISDEVDDSVEESAEEIDEAGSDLASVLADNGLENMASAVEEIDVAEMVGTEEFTFFAPADDAFRSLDADEIADLLADPTQLTEVLRRHAVAETIDSAALAELDSVETVAGTTLDVNVDGDIITVADGTVTSTDIDVDNGVVHVIDTIFIDA